MSKFPVKIRITFQRKTKYFAIPPNKYDPWQFTELEWEVITKGQPRGILRDYQLEKARIEADLRDTINSITNFSFERFEARLTKGGHTSGSLTLFKTLEKRIQAYATQERAGTSAIALSILNSLKMFFKERDPEIFEITVKKLKEYEGWMLKRGNSLATVGMYTRELRVMFNDLIKDELISRDLYPFGNGNYQPPKGKKVKSALYKSDIHKILEYQPTKGTKESFCRDLWIFSYLCNGMNLKDIAHLKYGNIRERFIYFKREKTARSNRTEKIITVPITDMAQQIIDRHGTKPSQHNNYIFPILDGTENADMIRRKVGTLNGLISDIIQRIAKAQNLKNTNITANSARDAFATISAYQGRPLSDISESLGHSSITVTQHYLAGFTDEDKFDWQNKLI
jgi:integrase